MRGSYSASIVVLSFGIAFLGSYLTTNVVEQYRQCRIGIVISRIWPHPDCYLGVMAVCLGGVGIWCMHFIGMSAVTMYDDKGAVMEVRYDIMYTLLSLLLVLIFSGLGCYISSHDAVFMKTRKDMLGLFLAQSSGMSLQNAVHLNPRQMMWIIGTHNPIYLVSGGACAASGVIVMHYVGMMAMKFKGRIVWNAGIIAASCVIAFLAATAAFWILFRFLSVYANKEYLRIVCGFTMAIAVCAMHFTGMMAASYKKDESVQLNDAYTMSGPQAFLSGLLVTACVIAVGAIGQLSELRYAVWRLSYELNRADETITNLPTTNPHACASQIRKYVTKRKASRFSLGVINNTYAMDQDDDEGSVGSGGSNQNGSSVNGNDRNWLARGQSYVEPRSGASHSQVHPISEANEDHDRESGCSAAQSKVKRGSQDTTSLKTTATANTNSSVDLGDDAASAVMNFKSPV